MSREHPNTVLSRQHFDELAEQYDDLFVSHMYDYDVTHEMILTMLPFSSADTVRVLELGPGTGNLTQKVLTRFPHSTVVGYDLSEQMLAQARAKLAAFEARHGDFLVVGGHAAVEQTELEALQWAGT